MNWDAKLEQLQERLGHKFADDGLLKRALTHGSFGDGRREEPDYERLEFLGDRVLGLLTAEILYKNSQDAEGALARKLNALVRKETCADIARDLDLGALIQMSRSAEKQEGRNKTSILGDVAESVLGAIYLDGGFEAAQNFYNQHWESHIQKVLLKSMKDPKTELQERAAATKLGVPDYVVTEQKGPDHNPMFQIEVTVVGAGIGLGIGASKKEAERAAAKHLLENWKKP